MTQESVQDYKTDFGDESTEDYNPVLIPKCEVKLEASDESDNESLEESLSFKKNGSEAHTCDECNKSFSQIKNLLDHVKDVHTYEPCPCPFCEGKTLKNRTELEQHLKMFHKDDINKNEIKEILEEIKNEVGTNDSDSEGNHKVGLKKHVQVVNNGVRHHCEHCDYSAVKKSNLNVHVRSVHDKVKYDCEHCAYKATFKGNLRLHVQAMHEGIKYPCDFCDFEATQKYGLKNHIKLVHKEGKLELKCDLCGESFSLRKQLNDHIKATHFSEPYPCHLCENKTLKDKNSFKRHMKRFHSNEKNKTSVKKEIEGELNSQTGELCEAKTETKQRVKKEKSAEGPPICQECGKEFANEARLRKHSRQSLKCSKVDGGNCVVCEECGKEFANKYLLGYHIKTVHSSEDENTVCEVCTKEFKTSYRLKQHLKRSSKCSDGEADSVNCDECGKEFADERRLKKHLGRSLKCCPVDEADSVNCDECGKEFADE